MNVLNFNLNKLKKLQLPIHIQIYRWTGELDQFFEDLIYNHGMVVKGVREYNLMSFVLLGYFPIVDCLSVRLT